MATYVFEDPFDDSFEDILASLFEQVEILWPDPDDRPDLREGSLLYTLLSPIAYEIQRFQSDLNFALEIGFLQFTFGEFLDLKGIEIGLPRKQGSQAEGILRFLGGIDTNVPTGTTVSNVLVTDEDEVYFFSTTESGTLDGIPDPVNVDEVQKIEVSGTGRFVLTFDGTTTAPLDATDTGVTVATALEALAPTTNYTAYNILGDSGIANAGGSIVTFSGGDVADKNIPPLTGSPYQVNERQTLFISGAGTFEVTFDGDETSAVFTETSTALDVVNAINGLSPTTADTYGTFSVSTPNSAAAVNDPGGITIDFDGGGLVYQDIPPLQVTSKTGTISEIVTEVVDGEDSDSVVTVTEITRGRAAAPVASNSDQNEVQRLSIELPELKVTTGDDPTATGVTKGTPGPKNQIQRIQVNGAPTSGYFTLAFNNGITTHETGPIYTYYGANNIKTELTALPTIGIGDVDVTLVSGGPLVQNGSAIFDIEFKNNLRETDFPLLTVPVNTLNPVTSIGSSNSASEIQPSSSGVDEVQRIEFIDKNTGSAYGPVPDGGEIYLSVKDTVGGPTVIAGPIPYNATAGDIEVALENADTYGRAPDAVVNIDADVPSADTASDIENKLENVPGIASGNVQVTLVSGTATTSGWSNPVFDIEFVQGLANQPIPLMEVTSNSLSPATTASISRVQVGSNSQNEKQRLTFVGSPTFGSINLNVYVPTVFGPNFTVTGGPLDLAPVKIQFTGKNRSKNFNPIIVTQNTTGVPTSGSFVLVKNASGTPTYSTLIDADDLTQGVESALAGITVRVANGVQTLEYSGGLPTVGDFTLTLDDGSSTQTTGTLSHNMSVVDLKTELDSALALFGPDYGTVEVYSSNGSNISSGATYIIHFLASNVKLFRHLAVTVGTPFDNSAVLDVGPVLSDPGTAYEIEFNTVGLQELLQYDEGNLTLAPEPNEPILSKYIDGDISTNEKQILTLTHPAGLFSLSWGDTDPYTTALISPYFAYDNATGIKHKIEAIAEINSSVSVTGGLLSTIPVDITFSGGTLAAINWPLFQRDLNTIPDNGYVLNIDEVNPGHGAGGGSVTGTVQYVYSIISEIGIEDGVDDIDYEPGFGSTGSSVASTPLVVSNNSILVSIAPILAGEDLVRPREIRVYRKLTTGFTSTPYRLVGTIPEADLKLETLDGPTLTNMYIVDNIPLSLFNATGDIAPTENTTGVLDLLAAADEIGSAQNVAERTLEILEDSIVGIDKVTNPEPFGGGSDIESDDDYRDRLIQFVQKHPGAGNIDDYISWALEVPGVSGATVIPEWQEIYGPLEGPGTVKVIVAGEDSTILPDSVVEDVRQFIAGTIAVPNPDREFGPASKALPGGDIEDGIYDYVYTYINVGKGETAPSAPSRVVVGDGNNTVELAITKGQGGIGVSNTIGRRIYRRKIDGPVSGSFSVQRDSEAYSLVAEVLENSSEVYVDNASFTDLPTWLGYPGGPYERRKAPRVNSTSLFDGEAPIGAHVTVESISEDVIWVSATIYPIIDYSLDGSGGKQNLTTQLDIALAEFFKTLQAGEDVKYIDIANVIHDHPGVHDFKDLLIYSPLYPLGITTNIPMGPGVAATYSSAGTFSLWTGYPFDK